DARGADQEVEAEIANELAARQEMGRRVEVRADVQRHRDLLPARLVEREALDPADRRAGAAREGRRVQREVLCQVEEFHGTASLERSILPMAFRGNFSSTTTRRGHL